MNLALSSPRPMSGEAWRNAILERLLSDAVEALEGDTERARASLFRALALVGEAPLMTPRPRRGGLASWQAKRTIALIDEHLEDGTRITELAAQLTLSHSHFSRAFKEFFGCAPQQFILERRIERAQGLMLTTDNQLCDIAQACGFADQAHFSRTFRKIIGLSPNAWRRAYLTG